MTSYIKSYFFFFIVCLNQIVFAQESNISSVDLKIYDIVDSVSAERLEADIRILADFGTRHTLSDTVSATRGIGAARRWIKQEFDKISSECNGCLDVFYQKNLVPEGANRRIPFDVWINNVVAVQRGKTRPMIILLCRAILIPGFLIRIIILMSLQEPMIMHQEWRGPLKPLGY